MPLAMRRTSIVVLGSAVIAACSGARTPVDPQKPAPRASGVACGGLDAPECGRAQGLLQAASAFGNVKHDYLLDPGSSLSPGRGVERVGDGDDASYSVLPTRCAEERTQASSKIDASTVDFSYVGIAIDKKLVSADVDLAPWLSAGGEASEHSISLVALAFVRDLDPQFFSASSDVAYAGESCSCGRASHFVGSVKTGGMLAYELRVRAGEVHGRALDFVKARLAAGDARVTQTAIGGLEVDGLDDASNGRPLSFRVKNPVPIAYAIYPLADVCKFTFPVPEISPDVLDFGEVPYGHEEKRIVHIVNRAAIELRATLAGRTFAVPALGSADVPLAWIPQGQMLGCEAQTRQETLELTPRDASAPITPRTHSITINARIRTGKATFTRHEHIDTGMHRAPDYAATTREWTCPPDYALAACHTEKVACGDGVCQTDGYAVNAWPGENGCHYGCTGPQALNPLANNFCRFDALMECRLKCR
jgi:hypothetical protein